MKGKKKEKPKKVKVEQMSRERKRMVNRSKGEEMVAYNTTQLVEEKGVTKWRNRSKKNGK